MGQSTDASICYGIPFDEGTEFPWDDYDGFDSWWAEQNGLKEPTVEYDTNKELYSKYWEDKRELEKKCPIEVITHCSGDYPMYIIGLRGTEQTANRGDTEEVKSLIAHNPTIITDFLKKYNIGYTQEPKWLLYSYWG